MELIDRLRKIMKDDFGIVSDDDMRKAIEEMKPVDLGIFTTGMGSEESDRQSA